VILRDCHKVGSDDNPVRGGRPNQEVDSAPAKTESNMKMFGASGGVFHPKMRLKRIRTCSSDSGCDVLCDSPDLTTTIMEDAMVMWEMRVEGVMKQEIARCKEVTGWAKEALRHAAKDEDKRRDVMNSWRGQLEGIMEFTKDLIECVNNDTKELMYDSSYEHDSASVIEELIEDDEGQEDEIMQLFLLSAIEGNKNFNKKSKQGNKGLMKEFMSIYKRNGKMFRHSRKSNKEVQTAYAKIKRHESFVKRRLSWEETKFKEEFGHNAEDFNYSEKMFQSVMDWVEIFSDWSWNLSPDQEDSLAIFAEWRWNFEETKDLKKNFYDEPGVEVQWNEFNFWKMSDNIQLDLDTGLADWQDCLYWQDTNDNWNIIHCLVDGEECEEDNKEDYHNYWDENAANQSIIDSLLDDSDQNTSEEDDEFIWESKQSVMALVDFESEDEKMEIDEGIFLWNDKDIAMSLLNSDDDHDEDEDMILWDNPKYINTLLNDDNDDEDLTQSDDENNNWTDWVFWNKFGPISEIVQAYEKCVEQQTAEIPTINIEEVFWDICLDDSRSVLGLDARDKVCTPKDPVNIFKSIRHIFYVPKDKKKKTEKIQGNETHLFDDMEDIYADWLSLALSDQRTEKKRSRRGRKKPRKCLVAPKLTKQYEFESSNLETKIPNQERKTAFAKNQKRLHAKMFAKQPRKI